MPEQEVLEGHLCPEDNLAPGPVSRRWVYVVDVDAEAACRAGMRPQISVPGQQELLTKERPPLLGQPHLAGSDLEGGGSGAEQRTHPQPKAAQRASPGDGTPLQPPASQLVVPRIKSLHPVVVVGW